jgi:hypothetical protein
VLLSSHILADVEALCDRVTIIRAGRAVETGTLAGLRHLTRTAIQADLVGPVDGLACLPGVHNLLTQNGKVRCAGLGPGSPKNLASTPGRPCASRKKTSSPRRRSCPPRRPARRGRTRRPCPRRRRQAPREHPASRPRCQPKPYLGRDAELAQALDAAADAAVGDLADRIPGVLGVEQRGCLAPDAVAVPVELHRGDLVDGFAAAGFAD